MIEFNPETHTYTLDGRIIPGVTSIIENAGLSDFSKINPDVLERAQKFGNAVHTTCYLYDINDLDKGSLDPALKPYLDAWIKFKRDTGFMTLDSEQIVYSKKHNYAGTYDKLGIMNGRVAYKTLVDIKSGTTLPKSIALQTSAYMEAHNEGKSRDEKIKWRLVVQLLEDGTYRMQEYKEKSDFSVFLACLNIRNWKKINNL